MNVVDIGIVILLAFGAVLGFKTGAIKKTADFLGMFIIVVVAFYLKNYLSVLMYENLPFFDLGGFIKGLDVINVLIYEVIAFVIVFVALLFVLKVIVMLTGLVEKLLKATIILSLPSKILGIVVGIIEMYVYIFIVLVVVSLPLFKFPYLRESKMADFMLNRTPVLTSISEEMTGTYGEVYDIVSNRKKKTNEEVNTEVLKLLLDKEVITKESARKLVESNKVHINDKSIVE